MLRNHHLARAIGDASWAEFARQVQYKTDWRGGELVMADRWYPSSQNCSCCHVRNDCLTLADRVFTCGCGHSMDRDLNAAVNLAQCGEDHHAQLRTPDPQAGGAGHQCTPTGRR